MAPAAALSVVLLAAAPPLSLDGAFQLAERGAPTLQSARLDVPIAEAGVQTAGAVDNPTLTLSAGPDEPKLSAAVEQKMMFLHRASAVRAAESELNVAQLKVQAERAHLHAEVRRAYAKAAALQERVKLAQDVAALAARSANASQVRFQTGAGSQLDALRAGVSQRRKEQDVVDRRTELQTARVALAIAIGVRDDEFGELTDLPDAMCVALSKDGNWSAATTPTQHPDLAVVNAERDAATARADLERTRRWPVPVVALELERLDGPPPYPGLRGTLALDLPVWNWNTGAIRAEEARAAQKEVERTVVERKLDAERNAARAHVAAAVAKSTLYSQTVLEDARKAVELSQLAYEAGKEPLQTVLQAQLELADVEEQAIAAAQDAQDALADFEEATGVAR